MKRRVISIFMVFALTISTVFSTGFANAKSMETQPTTGSSELKRLEASGQLAALKELSASVLNGAAYEPDDEVTIIVELEDKTLLDYVDGDVAGFAASTKGKNIKSSILSMHSKVKGSIKKAVKNASFENGYDYTAVINGFTLKATYKDLDTIKSIQSVKRAFVAGYYERPITEKVSQPDMAFSTGTIGSVLANETGYTGKGTVVAVVDTGLDYKHEAFSVNPEDVKYTKDEMKNLINTSGLYSRRFGKIVSDKVVFSYDYADMDSDVMPIEGGEHGTHVAGTVAGNNGKGFKGVAPDAQLMIMKVFPDSDDGAGDDVITVALEDAVTLGADAINMSLGFPAGFTESAVQATKEVYERIAEAGINLMVSAGNESYQGYKITKSDLPYTATPDYGLVGSPSAYAASLTVASVDNTKITSNYFTVDGINYGYMDNGPADMKLASLTGRTIDYVDAGLGYPENCKAAGLSGKVALISRGELPFSTKVANAYNEGAVAVIIYNNTTGTISMAVDNYYIPAVSITQDDGKALLLAENKQVAFTKEIGNFDNPTAGQMSDFSSWGAVPDLSLKPEITAPGGQIYSSMPGNTYASLDGTSMAAPHMAGAAAILRQYVNKNLKMEYADAGKFINNVLMSTADPVMEDEEKGTYYSPRKQGAGLVNVYDAIKSGAYLFTGENNRPKGEIGDSEEGKYQFAFSINNYSDKEKTYDISGLVQTDRPDEKGVYNTLVSQILNESQADIWVMYDGNETENITVDGNSTAELTVYIELKKDAIESLKESFKNGFYVEGYVFLESDEGIKEESLSLPFMGFCGDWESLDLFDTTVYDGGGHYYDSAVTGMFSYNNSNYFELLGGNWITGEYDKDNIAYSRNYIFNRYGIDTETMLSSDTGLLRNASEVEFTIRDSEGGLVNSHFFEGANNKEESESLKSFYYGNGGFVWSMQDNECLSGFNGTDLLEGDYTMTISARPAEGQGETQTLSYKFYVDNTAPELKNAEYARYANGSRLALLLDATDDRALQGVNLYMMLETGDDSENLVAAMDMTEAYNNVVDLYVNGHISYDKAIEMLNVLPYYLTDKNGNVIGWDVTNYKSFIKMFEPYLDLIFDEDVASMYTISSEYFGVAAVDYAWNMDGIYICGADSLDETVSGSVLVSVTDSKGNAMSSIAIDINGEEYKTDEYGRIKLTGLEAGEYDVTLKSVPKGYGMPSITSGTLLISKDDDTASISFVIPRSNKNRK